MALYVETKKRLQVIHLQAFKSFKRDPTDKALLKNAEPPIEFMNPISKDKGLSNYVVGQFFHLLMKDLKEDKARKYKEDGELSLAAE